MSILPNAICRFCSILIKISMMLFTEIGRAIQKFVWKYRRLKIAKAIWGKNNSKAGGITLPEFKLYYEAIVIYFFKSLCIYFEREGKGRRKRGREISMCCYPLYTPHWGTQPTTQTCAPSQ